jgi:hypothetical protein
MEFLVTTEQPLLKTKWKARTHRYPCICMYNDEREMGTEIGGD